MFHPMHLHGHTFQVRATAAGAGPRKDTVKVLPMHTVVVDFVPTTRASGSFTAHNLLPPTSGHDVCAQLSNLSLQ